MKQIMMLKSSQVVEKESTKYLLNKTKVNSTTEIKSRSEEVTSSINLTDSINIDEILTNIDDIKTDQISLTESTDTNSELKKLRKTFKKNSFSSCSSICFSDTDRHFFLLKHAKES